MLGLKSGIFLFSTTGALHFHFRSECEKARGGGHSLSPLVPALPLRGVDLRRQILALHPPLSDHLQVGNMTKNTYTVQYSRVVGKKTHNFYVYGTASGRKGSSKLREKVG